MCKQITRAQKPPASLLRQLKVTYTKFIYILHLIIIIIGKNMCVSDNGVTIYSVMFTCINYLELDRMI